MKKAIFFILVLLIFAAVAIGWSVLSDLPSQLDILHYRPESTVTDLSSFNWDEEIIVPVRKYISLNKISPSLRKAVVISEDDLFFQHSGINMTELKKAFQENLEKKRYARGASTITMQLAKNAFLFKKKTLIRKLKEIIITKRLEQWLDKRTILEYYLNVVEWGPNIYGAEAAAHYYFGKSAAQINLAEGTLLAAILPNPNYYNPFKNFKGARRKQRRVLKLMRDAHLISAEEMQQIIDDPLYLRGTKPESKNSFFEPDSTGLDSLSNNPSNLHEQKKGADSSDVIYFPEG